MGQFKLIVLVIAEISALEEKHKSTMTELSDVMIGMEQQFEERESEARAEFQSLRDEIKNKNLEERQSLRVQVLSLPNRFLEHPYSVQWILVLYSVQRIDAINVMYVNLLN